MLFEVEEEANIQQCLAENGVVGILNVLSEEEIERTLEDIQEIIGNQASAPSFRFSDQSTYHLTDNMMNSHGVVGKVALFSKQLMKNRLSPKMQKAWSVVYNCPASQLLAQHDRVAWMRPTVSENGEDWSKYKTPFSFPGLHLDIEPKAYYTVGYEKKVHDYLNNFAYNTNDDFGSENNCKHFTMGSHYQAVLNLIDNEDEDGGFHYIPRGHQLLPQWAAQSPALKKLTSPSGPNGRYNFTAEDIKFFKQTSARFPCPKGTLIVFDAILPHGTKPNQSSQSRLIQFMRYIPRSVFDSQTITNRRHCLDNIARSLDLHLTAEEKIVL